MLDYTIPVAYLPVECEIDSFDFRDSELRKKAL